MPRRNRPRRAAGSRRSGGGDDRPLSLAASPRLERRHGRLWHVQPMSAERAVKTYTCPGCGQTIDVASAHLVVWRSDGVLGDAADLASRRHWHAACWRVS